MGLNSTGCQLGIAIEFKGPTSDDVIYHQITMVRNQGDYLVFKNLIWENTCSEIICLLVTDEQQKVLKGKYRKFWGFTHIDWNVWVHANKKMPEIK